MDDDAKAKREGWALFTVDDGRVMIQRLDDPQSCGADFPAEPVFPDDDAAVAFVEKQALAGSVMHLAAYLRHGTKEA